MNITAKITGIKYEPLLCKKQNLWSFDDIGKAISKEATFLLKINSENKIAISWWVSSKRTRSYPYTRVYDTLSFSGRKITIIPVMKDEGKDGDRDFLQWDTISLMSLLGVYVIISYYEEASKSNRYENKITNQRFNILHIKYQIKELLSYQSDALHWNLLQVSKVGEISEKALNAYIKISQLLGVEMHSEITAKERIKLLIKGKDAFMNLSRGLAEKAQIREAVTIQPKESLKGIKATLTIKNYLGGYYFFTADEVKINNKDIYLIEGKHTIKGRVPSVGDIKDGLLKMILFTNLKNVKIDDKNYNPIPVLKLTSKKSFNEKALTQNEKKLIDLLKKEAKFNNFKIYINNIFLV